MTKKILTRDEEADEIISRLSRAPVRKITAKLTFDSLDFLVNDQISDVLSAAIAEEIDKEILKELSIYAKRNK